MPIAFRFLPLFGLLAAISRSLLDFRADTFKHRLLDFKAAFCLKAGIPNVNGDVLGSCFGSVNGSRYFICRPEPNVLPAGTTRHSLQYEVFSGHKWQHCIAGQSVSFLNGMMAFHGFAPGRRSDSYLMSLSSVPLELPLLVDQYGIQLTSLLIPPIQRVWESCFYSNATSVIIIIVTSVSIIVIIIYTIIITIIIIVIIILLFIIILLLLLLLLL